MKYNKLGRSGLKVSELSLGSWLTFGESLDARRAREIMRQAFDAGVNFFDNAEGYAQGKSESVMGEILPEFRREDLVISTKIFWGGDGPNDTGLSWKHLVEGTRNSLRRLKLDYVDLLFCHRPDPATPIEETVRAMDFLVKSGLVFYWGTSEWSGEQIRSAFELAEKYGCVPPVMEQPQYNLIYRTRVEEEYRSLYADFGLGLTIWSPLASGILTGKYAGGIPEGTRLSEQAWLKSKLTPLAVECVSKFAAAAAEIGATPTTTAIAWCLKNKNVSTVILGARNEEQLRQNLEAAKLVENLSDEFCRRIQAIFIPLQAEIKAQRAKG